MCFLPNCRYHIILKGNIKSCYRYWMHSVSTTNTWTVCIQFVKYRFSDKIVVKSGQLFDNVQRAVHFNHQNRGVHRMPSIAKKRNLRKKYKKRLLSSFQKIESTQTSALVFADRIEKVKKTKFELEPIKMVDCFLDGHGNYTSKLFFFWKKSLKSNPFLNSKQILYKSIGSVNDIVITPIKNPIAIQNAITEQIVPNVRQTHATHSWKIFLTQPIVNFQQVVLWYW